MDRAQAFVLALAAALAGGCARPARVVVGSKNFTEQVLLGEIAAQQIENRLGIAVQRKLDLGGTLLAHEALVRGSLDLYPEYTGTALTAILKRPPGGGAGEVFEQVRAAYQKRWRLRWLAPLGFNDTFAMMIRGAEARRGQLTTLSEAAGARAWRIGGGYEFRQRPDGLDGLLRAYGLRTEGQPVAMDLGLLYTALEKHNVDMIAANSTDGLAAVRDVAILRDDRHYFPPYECALVVRERILEEYPRLAGALGELSGKFSDATMRKLNYQVDGEHRPVPQVARQFLRETLGQLR
jgi:glycine betaine/choline ABC-type transport system substrate-binding protein